jgi:hypothetical protein
VNGRGKIGKNLSLERTWKKEKGEKNLPPVFAFLQVGNMAKTT